MNPEGVAEGGGRFIGNPFRVETGNLAGFPGCTRIRRWREYGVSVGRAGGTYWVARKKVGIISIVARRRLVVCGSRSCGGASGCGDGVRLIRLRPRR